MFIWQKKLKYRLGLSGKRCKRHRTYYNRKSSSKIKFYIILILVIVSCVFLFNSIENHIDLVIKDLSLSVLNSEVTKECNSAVSELINESNINYDSIINMTKDSSGNVKSLETNYREINLLKSELAVNVQNRIDKINSVDISIPILSMFSSKFYSGYGIPVSLRVLTNENVKVEFCNEFISAGINQTKHLIKVKVTTALGVVLPVRGDLEDIVTEVPIAESVIVGDVPDTYLDFN